MFLTIREDFTNPARRGVVRTREVEEKRSVQKGESPSPVGEIEESSCGSLKTLLWGEKRVS